MICLEKSNEYFYYLKTLFSNILVVILTRCHFYESIRLDCAVGHCPLLVLDRDCFISVKQVKVVPSNPSDIFGTSPPPLRLSFQCDTQHNERREHRPSFRTLKKNKKNSLSSDNSGHEHTNS